MYRRTILPFLFVLALSSAASSQVVTAANSNSLTVSDITGKPLPNNGPKTKGSPMLNEHWGTGMVRLHTGEWVKEVPLQFNLAENELYFQRNEQTYEFAEPVAEFILGYEEDGKTHSAHFRCGYPAVGRYTPQTYYEIAVDGPKVHLLKKVTKVEIERNEYGVGMGKEYKLAVQWVIFDVSKNSISRIKRDVSSLKEALPEYVSQINQMVAARKPKSEDDFLVLVQGLNR